MSPFLHFLKKTNIINSNKKPLLMVGPRHEYLFKSLVNRYVHPWLGITTIYGPFIPNNPPH